MLDVVKVPAKDFKELEGLLSGVPGVPVKMLQLPIVSLHSLKCVVPEDSTDEIFLTVHLLHLTRGLSSATKAAIDLATRAVPGKSILGLDVGLPSGGLEFKGDLSAQQSLPLVGLFPLPPGGSFELELIEEDDPGFPAFDDHDFIDQETYQHSEADPRMLAVHVQMEDNPYLKGEAKKEWDKLSGWYPMEKLLLIGDGAEYYVTYTLEILPIVAVDAEVPEEPPKLPVPPVEGPIGLPGLDGETLHKALRHQAQQRRQRIQAARKAAGARIVTGQGAVQPQRRPISGEDVRRPVVPR